VRRGLHRSSCCLAEGGREGGTKGEGSNKGTRRRRADAARIEAAEVGLGAERTQRQLCTQELLGEARGWAREAMQKAEEGQQQLCALAGAHAARREHVSCPNALF
jgi:hypothetical protein